MIIHRNGGAQILGTEPYITKDSYCDGNSSIQGESNIFASTLISSSVIDSSIAESSIVGARVSDSVLYKVKVEGQIVLSDVVAETCQLLGNWRLEAIAHIPTGIWHRAPRFQLITGDNGVRVGLTESTNGHAMMACWRKPLTSWLKYGPRLGGRHSWTAEQIATAKRFFEMVLDEPIPL